MCPASIKQIDEALAGWTEARKRAKHDDLSDLKQEGLSEVVTVLADDRDEALVAGRVWELAGGMHVPDPTATYELTTAGAYSYGFLVRLRQS